VFQSSQNLFLLFNIDRFCFEFRGREAELCCLSWAHWFRSLVPLLAISAPQEIIMTFIQLICIHKSSTVLPWINSIVFFSWYLLCLAGGEPLLLRLQDCTAFLATWDAQMFWIFSWYCFQICFLQFWWPQWLPAWQSTSYIPPSLNLNACLYISVSFQSPFVVHSWRRVLLDLLIWKYYLLLFIIFSLLTGTCLYSLISWSCYIFLFTCRLGTCEYQFTVVSVPSFLHIE
jgi:hypothetical protein